MAKISINIKEGKVDKVSDIIVGIDLGTTNSLVAYIKDGKALAVTSKNGKSTLVPSIIHFDNDGGIIVGTEARDKLISDPQNTIYSVKRLMGKSYGDLENFDRYFGYKIIDEDNDSLVKIRVGDKFYTPIELSAEILKVLKLRIEKDLGEKINKAVITVPAYFNDSQRQATRDAGKLAGLDVLRIVNEPTAASLAYGIGLSPDENRTIAVYDLGGGTFDISVLQIQNGIFEVLSTNGDTFLGGDDFDRAIIDFWIKENNLDSNILNQNKELAQIIRLEAEHAKKSLTNNDNFSSSINDLHLNITKIQFEEITNSLVQRTLDCCRNVISDAKISVEEIDHIVMVGGSTRIPQVQNAVTTFFGKSLFNDLNPDEVVALGAAIQADVLAGNQKDILLLDVTPLSLGIETVGGLMDTIIPRNSKVPNKVGRQYTTSVDGQKNLKVAVYQGERDLVNDNRKLGEFILKGIPPMPAGLPKIEIQFILNADGILKVKAKELRSNVETEIEIKSQYGISEEEMAKILIDSIQNAEADMKIRGLLEARNEANNILLSSDKFLIQNEEILSIEEKTQTKLLIENLRNSTKEEDKDAINKAMDDLNIFTSPLAHRAMDVNIQKAMKGKKV
ncbi:molecular chaperone DnaK [Saprospiraceae bacterium]|nr:molecular chaperone DnaK [Saprospiraceae bacterium]MDG1435581.1 molecular chaperone DnaK [Saprospiraceae bacterium]